MDCLFSLITVFFALQKFFSFMQSPFPAIPFLGIYPKECAPRYDRVTCMPVFIAALFKIGKLWKQPRLKKSKGTHVFPHI
jgi:hypothetical protein